MDKRLSDSDWDNVFAWAANVDRSGSGCAPPEPAAPGIDVSCDPFDRGDVAELYGAEDGENDGPDWICYGRLKDGRYFSIRAGCDYSGWDCQSSGSSNVANTREEIERLGLSDEERSRYREASA